MEALPLITQQKIHLLVEKVVLLEIRKYLDQLQVVLTIMRLFAVEQLAEELPHPVLETVRQEQLMYAPVTVKPQQLLQASVLETTSKALLRWQLITITATLPLHLLQQHTLAQLLWVLAAVQGLRLAQDIIAIQAGLAAD